MDQSNKAVVLIIVYSVCVLVNSKSIYLVCSLPDVLFFILIIITLYSSLYNNEKEEEE